MPKYLKHRVNGVVYPFNEAMSKNPAMELIDEPDPQFAVAANAMKAARKVETLPKTRRKRSTKAEMRERNDSGVDNSTPDEVA